MLTIDVSTIRSSCLVERFNVTRANPIAIARWSEQRWGIFVEKSNPCRIQMLAAQWRGCDAAASGIKLTAIPAILRRDFAGVTSFRRLVCGYMTSWLPTWDVKRRRRILKWFCFIARYERNRAAAWHGYYIAVQILLKHRSEIDH